MSKDVFLYITAEEAVSYERHRNTGIESWKRCGYVVRMSTKILKLMKSFAYLVDTCATHYDDAVDTQVHGSEAFVLCCDNKL